MEEILLGGVLGGIIVALADRSSIFRRATKAVIKTGYSVGAAVAAGGGETMERLKDLVSESKVEYESEKAVREETKLQNA